MESLIKFRMLADQLNEQEITLFLKKIIDTSDIYPLIISSIFDHFSTCILKSKQYDSHQINNITNTISQIIESRIYSNESNEDSIDSEVSEPSVIKIDDLAAPLLSIISSFLPQQDYISFQITNRNISIGCNSPCSLRSYFCPTFRKPTRIHINKCPLINHLSIDPSCKTQRDQKNVEKSMQDIISNANNINVSGINRFTCGSFGYASSSIRNGQKTVFPKLLSKLNNLQYLDMINVHAFSWENPDWNPPLLPELKGLSLVQQNSYYCSRTYQRFLQVYSSQITSLSCSLGVMNKSYPFTKLNELKIEINNGEALNRAIHFTNSLEMLSIVFLKSQSHMIVHPNGKEPPKSVIQTSIFEAFKTQKKLKYVEFTALKKSFDEIMNSISMAVNQLITQQKEMMKIQVILQDSRPKREMKWPPIITAVKKVVSALSGCENIKNWMFSCAVVRNKDNVVFSDRDKQLLQSLGNRYLVNYFQEDNKLKFAISNKENPMNGGYSSCGAYCL